MVPSIKLLRNLYRNFRNFKLKVKSPNYIKNTKKYKHKKASSRNLSKQRIKFQI